jgi:hypothetical protein
MQSSAFEIFNAMTTELQERFHAAMIDEYVRAKSEAG